MNSIYLVVYVAHVVYSNCVEHDIGEERGDAMVLIEEYGCAH